MFTQEDMSQAIGLAVNPKTIIVNRMNLLYSEEDCVVINFTDISTFQKLKVQEENVNLLKTLNASVHHEMVVPLKVNIEMAERLKSNLSKFPFERKLCESILISSNMVLLHANDFLDRTTNHDLDLGRVPPSMEDDGY